MATNIQEVLGYLNSIDVDSLKKNAEASDVLTLLNASRKLVRRLESPFQRIHEVSTYATQITYCLLILEDLGVWESWRRAGGGEASLTEVWERCTVACDVALLRECDIAYLERVDPFHAALPPSLLLAG